MHHFLPESTLTTKVANKINAVYVNEFTCDQRVVLMRELKGCVTQSLGSAYTHVEQVESIEERIHGKRELVKILSHAFVAANLSAAVLAREMHSVNLDDFIVNVQRAATR